MTSDVLLIGNDRILAVTGANQPVSVLHSLVAIARNRWSQSIGNSGRPHRYATDIQAVFDDMVYSLFQRALAGVPELKRRGPG
jgi:hypothetical protein